MLIYQYIVTGLLAIILLNFIANMILFRNIYNYPTAEFTGESPPLVSILIPARNEEQNIGRCLNSLLKQDYPNFEILVLDDNSMDYTAGIVSEISKKDNRVRLISGLPLKRGWLGKCWACHQLSREARGKYFLFTDADTLHFKDTVSKSLAALLTSRVDGISVYPKQITVTFHERMTVPFIKFAILSFVPLILVRRAKGGFFSTGIGQFFMFSREAYFKMGGHQSVKSRILEDIYLSKQVKKAGLKFMVFDGRNNIFCRMYRNSREVFKGFSKFIYPAFNYNVVMETIAMTFFSMLFLFPFIFVPLGIFVFDWSGLILMHVFIQVFMILLLKTILAIRFKNKILDIFFTPVSVCYMLVIAVNSYLQAKHRKGLTWKGRTYGAQANDEIDLVEDEIYKKNEV
jgi:chlorobactene glucosyltransferase